MRKIFTFLLVALLTASIGFSQTTLFEDDFESYSVGDYISSSDWWSTWSGSTGGSDDAQITDLYNNTSGGSQSLEIVDGSDIVGFFGDLTSGVYEVNFHMYIESGDGGYFNIEHAFGDEWAFEVYFDDGGSGELSYDGNTDNFTYPQDQWFAVKMDISLDDDEITLDIDDGTYSNTWTFSTIATGGSGSNVLDCIDFFGAANVGTPNYFIDDFEFIEVQAGSDPPEIAVDLTQIDFNAPNAATYTVTITNEGDDDLNFEAYEYYPSDTPVKARNGNFAQPQATKKINLTPQVNKADKPIPVNIENTEDEVLTWLQGDCTQAIGWNSAVTAHGVALFDHNMIADYIGMEVSNVIIYAQDLPVNGSSEVEVWEGYNLTFNGPVDVISTEAFTPVESGQASVDLSSPAFVNGKDLWVGWTFEDPGADTYCLAMDDGPPTADVNFMKTGAAWGVVDDPSYGNLGIVATLTGTAVNTWLDLDVTEGTVAGGSTQEVQVSVDLTDLDYGTYSCTLVIESNDQDEFWYEIPVTLEYTSTGIDQNSSLSVLTFPNPANDVLNIKTDAVINSVEIISISGKLVKTTVVNQNNAKIDISNLDKGVYIVNVNTENGKTSTKLIIE